MPLVTREPVPAASPREKVRTPRPDEHQLCGTKIRVREDQDAWRLVASEAEDYEHATVELVIAIRGTEYAQAFVRDPGDTHLIAVLAFPASSIAEYLVS